jgi:ribonuclease HI
VANIDGASRGNPGPAAAAWIIRDTDGQVLIEEGLYLGEDTNNRAEYFALLFALEDALMLKTTDFEVRSDSQLLVMQMLGEYRVKNAGLKGLHQRAKRMSGAFNSFKVVHVPREENREADRVANVALNQVKTNKPVDAADI